MVTAERTFAESPPPPFIDWLSKSYITSTMNFLANMLWIAVGVVFIALSRSYLRTGPRPVGIVIGAIGAVSLGAGLFL
jgi:hypothetical protein